MLITHPHPPAQIADVFRLSSPSQSSLLKKISGIFLRLFGFLFVPVVYATGIDYQPIVDIEPAPACTIEVSAGQNIQNAINSAATDAVICVKAGTYQENICINNKAKLRLRAVPDDRKSVVIDGKGVGFSAPCNNYFAGSITVRKSSDIIVEGFKVQNSARFGIVAFAADAVIMTNNHTYNTKNSGLSAWGDTSVQPTLYSSNITIHNNEVERANNGGEQENISVQDVDGFSISRNYVHSTGNGSSGIGGEGIDAKNGARNGYIFENTVKRNRANAKPCIYVDGYKAGKHTYNIEVFRNFVTSCGGPGIMIASEEGGEVENLLIHNNVVYDNHNSQFGIKISSYDDGGNPERHIMYNIAIFNNSLINNDGGIIISEKDPATKNYPVNFQNIFIANNLFEKNSPFPHLQMESILKDPETFKADYDGEFFTENNLFYPANNGSRSGAYIKYDGADARHSSASNLTMLNHLVLPDTEDRAAYELVGKDALDYGEPLDTILEQFALYQSEHNESSVTDTTLDMPVPQKEYEAFMAQVKQHLSVDFAGQARITGGGIDVGAIEGKGELAAEFSADNTQAFVGTPVTFTATPDEAITAWAWDFNEDGVTDATEEIATYTFEEKGDGSWDVTLTVNTATTTATLTKEDYIQLSTPQADFTASPNKGVAPLTVKFSNTSQLANGKPQFAWDFGDGSRSSEEHPSHTYTASGTYPVTLTIDNISSGEQSIQVEEPIAQFSISNTTPALGALVSFTDASTVQAISRWQWDFGDGSTANTQNPSHRYAQAGDYTVTLTVADGGNYSKTTSHSLKVLEQMTVNEIIVDNLDANFASLGGFGLYDPSSTDDTEYEGSAYLSWTTDSSAVWALDVPVAGRYDLYVYYPDSSRTRLGKVNYSIEHARQRTVIKNVSQKSKANAWRLLASDLEFDGSAEEKIELYHVSKHAIADAVKLVYKGGNSGGGTGNDGGDNGGSDDDTPDAGGNDNDTPVEPSPEPIANFTYNSSELTVYFNDASSNNPSRWYWDFGDGQSSTQASPAHTYSNSGSYTVTLIVDEVSTASQSINVLESSADFDMSSAEVSVGSRVQFTDTSTLDNRSVWHWEFGDGQTAEQQNPTHSYQQAGTYTVKLTVSNAAGISKAAHKTLSVIAASGDMAEIIVDNQEAGFSRLDGFGDYDPSSTNEMEYQGSAYVSWQSGSAAVWALEVPAVGQYDVYVYYPNDRGLRLGTVQYDIHHAGQITSVPDFKQEDYGNDWHLLASSLYFSTDSGQQITLLRNRGNAIADAVKLVPLR